MKILKKQIKPQISMQQLTLALRDNDESKVLKMFNQLIEETKNKDRELLQIKGKMTHIIQKSDELQKN